MMYQKSIIFCSVFLLHFLCNATQTASQPAQEKTQATYYQITQPPSFNALCTELESTLPSFPTVLTSLVAEFVHEPAWFFPFISLKMKGYQRNARSIDNDNIHLTIFGIKDNLPLTRDYILSTKQDDEEDDTFPQLWNKTEMITDLQKKLCTYSHKHLVPNVPYNNEPDKTTPKVIDQVKRTFCFLFTKSAGGQPRICLQKSDSQAVMIGSGNSLIYMTVSPQAFAKAYKNYCVYLQEERDKLGLSNKFRDKDPCYGMDLDRIIEEFPHEVMNELAEDETREKMPVAYNGGTLEQCIQHAINPPAEEPEEPIYDGDFGGFRLR